MRTLTLLLVTMLSLNSVAQPNREVPPAPSPPSKLALPPITKATLKNGLTAWIVERHEVPVVQINLVLAAGADHDPAGQFGLASFTADLLMEGAGGLDALRLADELDFLGAELGVDCDYDATSIDLHVPVSRLTPALELMKTIVIAPDFPDEEIERHRSELLTSFLQARDDAGGLMTLVFPSILFPSSHRYGSLEVGTEAVISELSRADLIAFHERAYRPQGGVIIVVGDVHSRTMLAQLEATFGDWQTGQTPLAAIPSPTVAQVNGRRVVLVDKPGAAQTVVRITRLGVDRSTPDFFELEVINTILGGSFTSRLNQNLREDHGYTYGASSGFAMRQQPGPFYAAANVQTDKTGAALSEFFKELRAIRETIPLDELNKAKNYLIYGYPAGFETTADLAGQLQAVWTYRLGEEYLESYVDGVQAVTAQDLQRVAKSIIVPEDVVVVLVGDREAILPQLEGLDLGPVTISKP